jgi:hypothetical protein
MLEHMIDDFRPSDTSLLKPSEDWKGITSLSLQDYYQICCRCLSQWQYLPISPHPSVKLGSIYPLSGSEENSSSAIAVFPDCRVSDDGWSTSDPIVKDYCIPYVQFSFY